MPGSETEGNNAYTCNILADLRVINHIRPDNIEASIRPDNIEDPDLITSYIVKVTCPCRKSKGVLGGTGDETPSVAVPPVLTPGATTAASDAIVAPDVIVSAPDVSPVLEIVPATNGGDAEVSGGAKTVAIVLDPVAKKALEGLTTTMGECAENIDAAPGAHCSSCRVVEAITMFAAENPDVKPARSPLLPTSDTPEAAAVRSAAAVLKCDSESCVVTHPVFRQYVVRQGLLSPKDLEAELELRYKAAGPRNTTALLSNYNIDETLRRWARVFTDFYPCPFAMMDFDTNGDVFGSIDVGAVVTGAAPVYFGPAVGAEKRRATCFGCVLNTDVSSGPGKHWVAVFVDARSASGPWTVEYFNSAGNPPPKPVVQWMERTRQRLLECAATETPNCRKAKGSGGTSVSVETIAVTDVDHQESQTECGLYALYYIRRRLEGTPYMFFFDRIVPDDAMTAFRAHIFRAS
jgi:Ulp1 protease family, C-terminal catalytic domain